MSDIDIFNSHEIFTGLELKFQAIRVIGGTLQPTKFTVRTEITPSDGVDSANLISDTFTKIHYFVEHVLENSIFIDRTDEWADAVFIDVDSGLPICENNLVHIPGIANNICIAKVLQCKFNALSDHKVDFGFVNLTSTDACGLTISAIGDPIDELPNMDDWIGEHTYFTKPWWARADASTMDIIPQEDANLSEPPEFAYSVAALLEAIDPPIDMPSRVIRAEFRPKIIKGGKED